MSKLKLAPMLEHTMLGDNITETSLINHLNEALEAKVFGVCIPLAWVPFAKKHLAQSSLKIVTVIDFPLGQNSSEYKAHEAQMAVELGADEIDMVLDYQALINKNYAKALEDIQAVIKTSSVPIKVIIETSALNHDQKVAAIILVALAKAPFIKTSTGMHKSGAKVEDIALMRALLPEGIQIKASGGIRDFKTASQMVAAGATRIGASKSREILS